jgi:hypothetical protein
VKLPGRLSGSTLGDVLGALYRERTSGQLELCELYCHTGATVPGRRHRIHLVGGMVSAIESPAPVPPIGETLRRLGFVDARAVERLVHRLVAGDMRPAGEILADAGISPEVVDVGLRQQLRDKLDALYRIEDASLAFRPPRPLTAEVRKIGPLSPSDFLHGRPRARDKSRGRSGAAPPPRATADGSGAPGDRADALRTLGLPANATSADIRRAFRRLAIELHPDRHQTRADAPSKAASFARVTAAYHRLVG